MLERGTTASARIVVAISDLASALSLDPEDAFPPVYATSRMIGLMELAAARVMRPALAAGELSVGVNLDVAHTAATPLGAEVVAEATFRGLEGRLYVFEVVARDPGGEIGRGLHRRAIIAEARLLDGAARRASTPPRP